jgi:hypothetical protein
VDADYLAAFKDDIKTLRPQVDVRLLIASCHWGLGKKFRPTWSRLQQQRWMLALMPLFDMVRIALFLWAFITKNLSSTALVVSLSIRASGNCPWGLGRITGKFGVSPRRLKDGLEGFIPIRKA